MGMRAISFVAAIALATPAMAEVLDTKSARAQLFPIKGYEVRVSGKLSKADQRTVQALVPLMAKRLNQPVRYYASIAYSPADGLVHEALQGALNYHTPDAADAAAISACNTRKTKGNCAIAARVLPKGYGARSLTLSVDATAAFDRKFRRLSGPKAFAISPRSGAWGYGATEAAAKAACGASDCKIVIKE